MFSPRDDLGALVADIGSFAVRVGFAGEDFPRAHFPTVRKVIHFSIIILIFKTQVVGVNHLNGEIDGTSTKKVNFDLSLFKEDLTVESPLEDGLIADWDVFEKVWDHSLASYLKVEMKETPVLFAEKPYNPPKSRQRFYVIIN